MTLRANSRDYLVDLVMRDPAEGRTPINFSSQIGNRRLGIFPEIILYFSEKYLVTEVIKDPNKCLDPDGLAN